MWSCDQSLAMKFYNSVAKLSKRKVRKLCGLIPTFVKITGLKLIGGLFTSPHPE